NYSKSTVTHVPLCRASIHVLPSRQVVAIEQNNGIGWRRRTSSWRHDARHRLPYLGEFWIVLRLRLHHQESRGGKCQREYDDGSSHHDFLFHSPGILHAGIGRPSTSLNPYYWAKSPTASTPPDFSSTFGSDAIATTARPTYSGDSVNFRYSWFPAASNAPATRSVLMNPGARARTAMLCGLRSRAVPYVIRLMAFLATS